MTTLLAIGTGKGLFLATSTDGRRSWELGGPHFPMTGVYAVAVDSRRAVPRLLAGMTSSHFGPSVATSDDLGSSWCEPEHAPVAFPADTGASLGRVWQLTPAGPTEPDVVWAGTEPSALFRSADGGHTFELVRALWDHPHRPQWERRLRRAGGAQRPAATRTTRTGSWWPCHRRGLPLPTTRGELGAGQHRHPRRTSCPTSGPSSASASTRSPGTPATPSGSTPRTTTGSTARTTAGRSWAVDRRRPAHRLRLPDGGPPARAGTIWSFPLVGGRRAHPARTTAAGLPFRRRRGRGSRSPPACPTARSTRRCCATRCAPTTRTRPGSTSAPAYGEVYASPDEGDSWSLVAAHLPDVLCVRAVEV